MKLRTKQTGSFMTGVFTLTEKYRTTKLYKVQGLDFTVEQTQKGGRPAYLSHYSNPGTMFFLGLVKFLHDTRSEVPVIEKPREEGHDEFKEDARFFAMDAAASNFPLRYQYYYDLGGQGRAPTAELRIRKAGSGEPELEIINSDGRTLIISVEAAQEILRLMPRMYPGFTSFNLAYTHFLEEAAKRQGRELLRPTRA